MIFTILMGSPAAGGNASNGGDMTSFLIMMVLIFLVMYFMMIRPQQKRQKELNNFRNSLEAGQKVITAGGIYGKIKEVKETYVDRSMIMRDSSDNIVK